MVDKITLAQADSKKRKPSRKVTGDIPLTGLNPAQKEMAVKLRNSGYSLVSAEERQLPIHILVQRYQHEALKTLVHLMQKGNSETIKRQCANDILFLGGNSAKMLELQAVMTGRSKDISQMSAEELEAFVQSAKSSLQARINNAQNVTPDDANHIQNGGIPTILGGDIGQETEDNTWL